MSFCVAPSRKRTHPWATELNALSEPLKIPRRRMSNIQAKKAMPSPASTRGINEAILVASAWGICRPYSPPATASRLTRRAVAPPITPRSTLHATPCPARGPGTRPGRCSRAASSLIWTLRNSGDSLSISQGFLTAVGQKHLHHRASNSVEQTFREGATRGAHQGFVGGEQFARAGVAEALQSSFREGVVVDFDGSRIRIGIAGDLTRDPIASADARQQESGALLAAGEV